jgi:hypothetical protein
VPNLVETVLDKVVAVDVRVGPPTHEEGNLAGHRGEGLLGDSVALQHSLDCRPRLLVADIPFGGEANEALVAVTDDLRLFIGGQGA